MPLLTTNENTNPMSKLPSPFVIYPPTFFHNSDLLIRVITQTSLRFLKGHKQTLLSALNLCPFSRFSTVLSFGNFCQHRALYNIALWLSSKSLSSLDVSPFSVWNNALFNTSTFQFLFISTENVCEWTPPPLTNTWKNIRSLLPKGICKFYMS